VPVLPASTLIAGNVSVTAVASMLGHTVAECFETYAHWWPSENYVLRKARYASQASRQQRPNSSRASDAWLSRRNVGRRRSGLPGLAATLGT
jgi:hypothetical protein